MNVKYLFPTRFKMWGWIILIPSAILGFADLFAEWQPAFFDWTVPALYNNEILGETTYFGMVDNNVLNEIFGILMSGVSWSLSPDLKMKTNS